MLVLLIFLVGFAYYALSMWLASLHTNQQLKELNGQLKDLNSHLNELVDQRTAELRGALEQVSQSQEISGREVQHVAHDLRNALAAVQQIVASSPLAAPVSAALGYVEHLIADMLLVSALKNPEFMLSPQVDDLFDVTNTVLSGLPDDVVQLLVVCVSQHPQVWIDGPRVQRVLHNIIGNAIKYGATRITLRIDDAPEHILLAIHDNGYGIAPQQLTALQQRVAVSGTPSGYGIGLRVAGLIMQRSGGWLTIESAGIYRGTTVTLAFPRSAEALNACLAAAHHSA